MKNVKLINMILAVALSLFANATFAKELPLLDQTHLEAGIKCASCHGKAEPRQAVTMMKCVKCHNTQKLTKKTENFKPTNPHKNRHFDTETDCTNCHKVHQKSENYCTGCHNRFDFVVP